MSFVLDLAILSKQSDKKKDSSSTRLLTVNTFIDNCDLKVPKLPLLTWTVATLEKAEGLVKTLQVIGLEWKRVVRSHCGQLVPWADSLPLAENGMVDQVGRSVHAAEGVVDRLVSHR